MKLSVGGGGIKRLVNITLINNIHVIIFKKQTTYKSRVNYFSRNKW